MNDANTFQCKNINPFIFALRSGQDPYGSGLNTPPKHADRCPNGNTSMLRLGVFQVNRRLRLGQVIDGTSKTSLYSELLTVEGLDSRGAYHFPGTSLYMHDQAPNTVVATINGATNNWPDFTRYCTPTETTPCDDPNGVNDPGNSSGWRGQFQHTARSNHPGGVNLVRVDCSSTFISDDVELAVWHALATPDGEEVVSN